MSKIIYFLLLGGLLIAAVAAININSVNADDDDKFIPISVLSKKQANYGVDTNLVTIPAVSADILEDKVRDTQGESSVQIIRYTSLPVENQGTADQDNAQSADQGEPHNNQGSNGNGNSNQNMNNNGNGNSNQNTNNNGNGNAGGGNNNSNNDQGKEKETKPDKSNAPQDKATSSENKNTKPAPETAPDKIK